MVSRRAAPAVIASQHDSSFHKTASGFWRRLALPLFLMSITPIFAIAFLRYDLHHGALSTYLLKPSLFQELLHGFTRIFQRDPAPETVQAVTALSIFCIFELALMRLLPGRKYHGPTTRSGFAPTYTDNGLAACIITWVTFLVGASLGFWEGGIIWYLGPTIISLMCVFSFLFCGLLLIKSRVSPSPGEATPSSNLVSDYFWGTELYPRILGFDVKLWTNCRFGMMMWGLTILSCCLAAKERHGSISPALLASSAVQLIYILKFYLWESGYMSSLDIMHDKAGYYLCWGCCVWVPAIYCSQARHFVDYGRETSPLFAGIMGAVGLLAVYMNYAADAQRALVRSTDGKCTVWGRPPSVIRAKYTTVSPVTGKPKEMSSLLLTSGWWGISRHFHYVPEILAAFCWSASGGFSQFLPFFYVCFLTGLLVDRSVRDDKRCAIKYGKYWDEYRALVPYKIIPGIF